MNTGKSKQGVDVVNIKTPNSSGLSHNIFNSFEVNENGVIFNNSAEDTNTTIGGEVNANTNLTKGEEASIILGEVKSKLASNISGFMEVAGLKSDLIISNLNGINCNGCGFINVNRGVLTTGLPLIDEQGRLQSFTANSGSITIGKNGLNAKGAESLEIISPLLNLNGYIEGNDTSIILGGSIYNYNTKKAEKTSTNLESYPENVNSVISSSNFGGIYGSRIRLVNLEDKIGLQVDFKIKAENENIEIESKNLNIKEQGSLEANNNINIKAEQISNSGEILAQNELTIKGNSLNNYNTLSGYNVYLYTDSFINNEGANLNAFNNIYITGLNGQNASYVGNISANIKANNNIDIFTNTFENKLAWYDFKIAYGNWVQTKYYYLNSHTWNEGIKRRYREDRFYVQRHRNITYDFEGALSSDFYAGGNINIQAESIFNQNSSIKALGDINLNANVVQNINEHKEGYKEEESYTHRVVHYYKRDWIGKWQYEGIAYTKNTDFKHLGNTVNSFTQGTSASIIADGLINITTNYLQNGQEYAGIRAEYIDTNVIKGSNININASGSVVNNGLFKAEDGIDIFATGSVVNNGHMVTEDKTNIHANTIESYENERDALIISSENLASEMEDLAKQINKYKGKIYSLENKYLNQYDILANKFNLRMERLLFIDDELIALYRGDKILTNINIEAESITGKGGYFASDIINFGTDDLDLKAHEIQTYVHVKPSVIYKNKDTGKVCNESNKIECYSKVTIEQEGANGKGTTTIIDYNSIVVDSLIDNNYSYTSNLESFKLEARYLANFDVENNFTLSSSIIETPSLNINANNVVITAQSEKSFNTILKNNLLFDEKETNIIASSITSGSVNINTEGNFTLQGSKLEAGSLKVNSQDNIMISHLNNYNSWSYNTLGGYQEYGNSTSIAESNIIAGSIDFTSGNNTSIIASSVFGQNDASIGWVCKHSRRLQYLF